MKKKKSMHALKLSECDEAGILNRTPDYLHMYHLLDRLQSMGKVQHAVLKLQSYKST